MKVDRSILDNIKITDNILFSSIFENLEIVKMFLELVLNIKVKDIKLIQREKVLDSAGKSKGVRFDVYVEDEDTVYDIEIQTKYMPDIPQRTRYYQDRIDIELLNKGDKLYSKLKKSYIIFICLFHPFVNKTKSNKWFYMFENMSVVEDEILKLEDGTYKVFINTECDLSKITDDNIKSLVELLKNGYQSDTKSNLTDLIVKEASKIRNDTKWRNEYMTILEEIREEGREEGRKQGKEQGIKLRTIEIAKFMLIENENDEKILKYTGLSLKQLEEIKKDLEK